MKLKKISERIFFSTIKLNLEDKTGNCTTATGFFVSRSINKKEVVIFLVASKDLIKNSVSGTLAFHEAIDNQSLNVKENENLHIRIGEKDWKDMWFCSSTTDDFVIAPIMPIVNFIESKLGKFCFFQPIDLISSSKNDQLNDISLSEDILFLAYPSEIVPEDEYMPVLGRAKLATPLFKKFDNKPEFLIHSISSPNVAGSPVFILNEGSFMTNHGQILGNRFLFLGITNGSMSDNLVRVTKAHLLEALVDEFIKKNVYFSS
jgi:hypothetical protein